MARPFSFAFFSPFHFRSKGRLGQLSLRSSSGFLSIQLLAIIFCIILYGIIFQNFQNKAVLISCPLIIIALKNQKSPSWLSYLPKYPSNLPFLLPLSLTHTFTQTHTHTQKHAHTRTHTRTNEDAHSLNHPNALVCHNEQQRKKNRNTIQRSCGVGSK